MMWLSVQTTKRGMACAIPLDLVECSRERRVRSRLRREYRHIGAALLAVMELHLAVAGREQGVILAEADILARMHLGAALADQDVAGDAGDRKSTRLNSSH